MFADSAQLADCVEQVRVRIGSLPEGAEQLQRLDAKAELAYQSLQRKPIVTSVLLGVITAVFLAELHFDAVGDGVIPTTLIDWGANVPRFVRDGQWYRLISANFLHAGVLHIYLNGLALWVLGWVLEKIIGHTRFLLVFLGSALLGALASALLPRGLLSVGASTALFGLLGAYAMLSLRYRRSLPALLRQTLRWWIIILGINTALPLLLPVIDVAAHLGGFVAGVLIIAAVVPGTRVFQALGPPARPVITATLILSGVFFGGLARAVQGALTAEHEDRSWFLEMALEHERLPPSALNNLAWALAIDAEASPRELVLALAIAERAAAEPNATTLDTLATVCYRNGQLQRAVSLERQSFLDDEHFFHASQLARFLYAHGTEHGPLLLGGAAATDVRLRSMSDAVVDVRLRSFGWSGTYELTRPNSRGFTVYAAVRRGGAHGGLLRVCWPPRATGELEIYLPAPGEIGLIDASGSDCPENEVTARFWDFDYTVKRLP